MHTDCAHTTDLPAGVSRGFDPDKLERLRAVAESAEVQHWAPYSNFKVLVAIETDAGYFGGSNVENANFTLTVHGEQNAILAALHAGALKHGREFIKTVYVRCASEGAPCGGCRQAINEFAAPDCVWVGENTATGEVLSAPFSLLMPLDFGPRHLGI